MTTTLKSFIPNSNSPLFAIYGPGRSGTTWLGSIINSHPEVAYRFEPIRSKDSLEEIKHLWETVQSHKIDSDKLNSLVYQHFLPAYPLLDKPPFFQKNNVYQRGHKLIWNIARQVPQLNKICKLLYSPKGVPPLIFKEVRWKVVEDILAPLKLQSVFIIRGPYGTVSSRLKGQRKGLMPVKQLDNIQKIVEKYNPQLLQELSRSIYQLNNVQKNAVLWRVEAERMFNYAQNKPECMVVVYEDLCQQPLKISREIFSHFDIPWHTQTEKFIQQSTANNQTLKKKEKGIDSYFSVSRNSLDMANKWSRELDEKDRQQIDEIVCLSKVYQVFSQKGFWI